MQIEQRADGFYFRFYRSEPGYETYTEWFGSFPNEEQMKGAIWALYNYGYCKIEINSSRLYVIEDAIYERFREPDIL